MPKVLTVKTFAENSVPHIGGNAAVIEETIDGEGCWENADSISAFPVAFVDLYAIYRYRRGNFSMQTAEDNFTNGSIEWEPEVVGMSNDFEKYSRLYRELAELIGETSMRKLWKAYGGISVTFPTKLFSQEYIRGYVLEHQNDLTPTEMAKELMLTERRVRQILKDVRSQEDVG